MQYIQKLFNALFTILFFVAIFSANIQKAHADGEEAERRLSISEYRTYVASISDKNKIEELLENELNDLVFYRGQLKLLKASTSRAEYSNYRDWQKDCETTEQLLYETKLRIQILTKE